MVPGQRLFPRPVNWNSLRVPGGRPIGNYPRPKRRGPIEAVRAVIVRAAGFFHPRPKRRGLIEAPTRWKRRSRSTSIRGPRVAAPLKPNVQESIWESANAIRGPRVAASLMQPRGKIASWPTSHNPRPKRRGLIEATRCRDAHGMRRVVNPRPEGRGPIEARRVYRDGPALARLSATETSRPH